MEVVDICMLSNSHHESFQKNHDDMSVSNFFWLGPTNKLSNFFDLYNNLVKLKYFLTFEYVEALSKGYKTLVYLKKSCQMSISLYGTIRLPEL